MKDPKKEKNNRTSPLNQIHKLFPGFGLLEYACKVGSGGNGMLLLHTAHLHAEVLSFDDNHYTHGVECFLNTFFDLGGKPFLYL